MESVSANEAFILFMLVRSTLTPFSDKAWFYVDREVNLQNSRYWSSCNVRLMCGVPLHDSEIGVWCSTNTDGVIGLTFFRHTVKFERYVEQVLCPFSSSYQMNTIMHSCDKTGVSHTARMYVDTLREVFGDGIVSNSLWSSCSPDLNPCDLWGTIRQS
jgi:hypothetical protein